MQPQPFRPKLCHAGALILRWERFRTSSLSQLSASVCCRSCIEMFSAYRLKRAPSSIPQSRSGSQFEPTADRPPPSTLSPTAGAGTVDTNDTGSRYSESPELFSPSYFYPGPGFVSHDEISLTGNHSNDMGTVEVAGSSTPDDIFAWPCHGEHTWPEEYVPVDDPVKPSTALGWTMEYTVTGLCHFTEKASLVIYLHNGPSKWSVKERAMPRLCSSSQRPWNNVSERLEEIQKWINADATTNIPLNDHERATFAESIEFDIKMITAQIFEV